MLCTSSRFKHLFITSLLLYLTIPDHHVDGFYTRRERYASRMLKITPKECHAPDFPNITGICMISLECQQRSGTVIGACRDGHLFGACCHEPLAAATQPPPQETSPPSTTERTTTTTSTSTTTTTRPTTTTTSTPLPSSSFSTSERINDIFSSSVEPDPQTTMHIRNVMLDTSEAMDGQTSIPSLIDTFSELSPTFLSQLALDEHTTGIYTNVSPENRDDLLGERSTTSRDASSSSSAYPDEVVKDASTEIPADLTGSSAATEDEIRGSAHHDADFKDNMIKYIDDIVTVRSMNLTAPEELENISDIPFSTFTIVSPTASEATSEQSQSPASIEWSTSSTSERPTALPLKSSTNEIVIRSTSDVPSSSSKSDEILAVSVTQTVGTSSTESNEITSFPTGTSTESTYPTKFTFSKLKYTPRPFKPRPTTKKVYWTRPPASTTAVWNPVEVEEDEEEDDGEDDEKVPTSSTSTTTTSTEQAQTTAFSSTEPSSTEPSSTEPSSTEASSSSAATQGESWTFPSSTLGYSHFFSTDNFDLTSPTILSYLTGSSSTTSNNNISRSDLNDMTTNEIPTAPSSIRTTSTSVRVPLSGDYSRSTVRAPLPSPSSVSWDSSIDSFVDQVVEGIVQDLNKSNNNKIDEIIFNQALEKKQGFPAEDPSTTPKAAFTSSVRTLLEKVKQTTARSTSKTKTTAATKAPVTRTTTTKLPAKDKVKLKGIKKTPSSKTRGKNKVKPVKKTTTAITTQNTTRKRLNYKRDCGVRPLIKKGRIVGGTPSRFGSWPWHALVKETVWWGIFSKIKCGGVLIGAQHVLTAAHCQPQQTGTLSVVLGITDSDDADSRAITKVVRRVIPHPQFNPRTYENDIAILELESPIDFQPHIVPICLPRDDDELEGKTAYVTGMGLLKHDGERPLVLQEVDLPILNNTECQKMFVRSGNRKPIIESFICAGYEQGRKDSCGGDSGGPLSVKRGNGQWVLAGTVSHGIKCALPDQPGVYMRTSYYKPWIDRVLSVSRSRYRGIPRCNAPPLICARQRHQQQARKDNGFVHTLFRIFRLARKMVDERRSLG